MKPLKEDSVRIVSVYTDHRKAGIASFEVGTDYVCLLGYEQADNIALTHLLRTACGIADLNACEHIVLDMDLAHIASYSMVSPTKYRIHTNSRYMAMGQALLIELTEAKRLRGASSEMDGVLAYNLAYCTISRARIPSFSVSEGFRNRTMLDTLILGLGFISTIDGFYRRIELRSSKNLLRSW